MFVVTCSCWPNKSKTTLPKENEGSFMVQIWSAFLLKTTINHFFFNLKQTPIPKETFLAVCKLKCLQLMGSKNATKSLNWCARFLKIFYRAVSIIFHILYGMRKTISKFENHQID